MAVQYTEESAYAQEAVKWESQHTKLGPPGRPYKFQPFPTWMFLAGRNEQGKIVLVDKKIAETEREAKALAADGWENEPLKALERQESRELEYAKLAAERQFDVRRLGAKVQDEVAAVEAANPVHLPTIPETPIRHRVQKTSHKKPLPAVQSLPEAKGMGGLGGVPSGLLGPLPEA